jgi:hypothetical protein
MKRLDNYKIWNEAFYHLGAKGSPENILFDFSKEEFFVRGLIFAENDARTTSAFAHWVVLFGKDLNHQIIKNYLDILEFNQAWLGYYLDLINNDSFKELYSYAKALPELRIMFRVRQADVILLKWGIYSKPLSETPSKYLHLEQSVVRVF